MNYKNLLGLITLGMLWGVSFLFIRVAVPEFGAVALMAVRVAFAAMVLVPLVLARRQLTDVAVHWRPVVVMGVLHYAIPFSLFAYAMQTLPASYTSIINASSPLFAGLVARFWLGDRLSASRMAGLVAGVLGVALLVWDKLAMGSDSSSGPGSIMLAVSAAVVASFCYGLAAVIAKKHLANVDPVGVAGGSMVAAAVLLLPLSYMLWPEVAPSAHAFSMAAILGVVCTAAAFVLYFHLISVIGPSRAITVTFLIPVFAVVFSVLLIGEKVTATMLAGGAIIAVGTALSTGLIDVQTLLRRSRDFSVRSIAVVMVLGSLDDSPIDLHAAELVVTTPVYVGTNVFAHKTDAGWDMFATVAASAEIELQAADRPWLVSLFGEYHYSDDERVDGTVFVGALAKYTYRDWDVTSFWFSSRFPGVASRQTFMGRARHRFSGGQKLGAEYLAYVDEPGNGELKMAYSRPFGRSGQLRVLAGAKLREDRSPLARIEFSWRIN
jgi:drug/metabolite transporter (DMT)-like permease